MELRTFPKAVILACALAVPTAPSHAREIDPSTYLLLPGVTEGEHEVDVRMGDGSTGRHIPSERDLGIGFGVGVNSHWFTELAVQYRALSGTPDGFDSLEWENILQVAEPGEWPVDLGIMVAIDRPRDLAQGTALTVGPLLQKEFGRIQVNFNVLGSRLFGASPTNVHWAYQFQVKYRQSQAFEYGVQGFGSPASTSRAWVAYEDQTHRLGPVVLGKFPLGGERAIQYNAGLLFGTTSRSPSRTLRLQVEYEF